MQTIEIIAKEKRKYALNVDEDSFKRQDGKKYTKWEIEFELYGQKNKIIGHGKFKTKSMTDNDFLSDDEIFNKLIEAGIKQIKKSIENGDDIESVGYNF
ncbi:MAG: hypothetical protein ACD_11C00028G0008 [uncultured bacterium]|nr:MAG: hypothetical protein ACD_11C00028G0008 [uncultured bacterium]HBR71604.1 hypothetical protein [Candidatus Moranbacteria bacterium]